MLHSYLPWCVYPGQVTKMRVHRNCHHFTVHVTKFICFVAKSHNFRGADKGAGGKTDQAVIILPPSLEKTLTCVSRH